MSIEIERKFVMSKPPAEFGEAVFEQIDQGYLAITDDGIEVRVRRIGERAVLTVKQGTGERRLEEEVDIPLRTFDAMWALTEGRRVTKRRGAIDRDGHRIELDVYTGTLDGLVVAEVEFESEVASASFRPPDWIGREVTGDERYANQGLALAGMPRP